MRFKLTMLSTLFLACASANSGHAIAVEGPAHSGTYSLEVTDEWGSPLSTYDWNGRTYVLGERGRRYQIRVRNSSPQRVEAVISVDGRDVLAGRPATWNRPGYVIEPYGEVLIDGFRLDLNNVASFRFSSVRGSYASRMGNAREVGVIGVAIFPERQRPIVRRPVEQYNRYDSYGYDEYGGGRSGPEPSKSAEAAPSAPNEAAPSMGDSQMPEDRSMRRDSGRPERPGLGTAFGEQRYSHVTEVSFARARPNRPDHVLVVRYNDRPGLIALGIPLDPPYYSGRDEVWRRETAQPFRGAPTRFAPPPAGWTPDDP